MKRATLFAAAALWGAAGPALGQDIGDAPDAPTTQPAALSELEQLKLKQREVIERQYAGRPVAGPFDAKQVVRIEIVEGHITVDTDLPPAGVEQRIRVTDDPAVWLATVNHRPDGAPVFMAVQRYDFSQRDNVFTHAMVTASTSQVSLSGAVETLNGMTQVELIDRSPLVTPDEGLVDPGGLRVFVNGYDAEGMRTMNLRVEAPDLRALREAQPEVVNTHLRQMLRELGQDHVLAVDAKLAWQVLGGERPFDPKVMERLHAILPRLDSDAFAEREQAAEALRALGEEGAAAAARIDRQTLSPEQNARIDEFLDRFQPVTSQKASALAEDPDFLLDVLLVDELELRKLALERLRHRLDHPIDFEVNAPAAQRSERVEALRRAIHADAPTTGPTQP